MFHQIQAVLFDKDGTLADSQGFLRSLGQKRSRLIDAQIPGVQEPLLMAFGLDNNQLNPAGLLAVGTRRENEIAAAAYVAETGRDWIDSLELVHSAFLEADSYLKRKADHTPLFPESEGMLRSLTDAGLALGILSSDTTENVQAFARKYDITSYFQLLMGVDREPGKPDPALLSQACATLGISLEATLLIGDSQADIQMATAANIAGCIGVTWGGATAANLTGASAVIDHWSDLQILG